MNASTAVAYVSSSATLLPEPELEALLQDARAFNRTVGVTGVLLHHDGSFFQYFEGLRDSADQVYDRIRASRRHHTIFELFRGPVAHCIFTDWQMGFAKTPQSAILKLSQAEWRASAASIHQIESPSPGVELLTAYWKSVAPYGSRA